MTAIVQQRRSCSRRNIEMTKKLRSVEVIEAWKEGLVSLRSAVKRHWKIVGLPGDDSVLMAIELILGFANLGILNTPMQVDDGRELTIEQAIDEFKLADFLG